MIKIIRKNIPVIIAIVLAAVFGIFVWWGLGLIGIWIGLSFAISGFIDNKDNKYGINFSRKISMILILPIFIIFMGIMQRENVQLEEAVLYTVYFISTGIFTRVMIHYAIAKLFGPLIWGRAFCGWVCWTAAILEWLPIKENNKIPKKWTYLRIPALIISILIPFIAIQSGYDYFTKHIYHEADGIIQLHKFDQLIWFLIGNAIYYVLAIILAFVFKKKRAFCKILCPVSLVMKAQTKIAMIKRKPSGEKCIECGKCNTICPMDVDVKSYISTGEKVLSTECIYCGDCKRICPVNAIS